MKTKKSLKPKNKKNNSEKLALNFLKKSGDGNYLRIEQPNIIKRVKANRVDAPKQFYYGLG